MIDSIFTTAAEWISMMVLVILSHRRYSNLWTGVIAVCAFPIMYYSHDIGMMLGIVGGAGWMGSMAFSLIVMYLLMRLMIKASRKKVWFLWGLAFVFAELSGSVITFLGSFFGKESVWTGQSLWINLIRLAIYLLMGAGLYFMEHRIAKEFRHIHVSIWECLISVLIAITVFVIGNLDVIVMILQNGVPSSNAESNVIDYTKVLVNLCGVAMIYSLQNSLLRHHLEKETTLMTALMERQHDQYEFSRESMELINRKYHDLKHQIQVIESENDDAKKGEYLQEIKQGLDHFYAKANTGNAALDTVLTSKQLMCEADGITMITVADGSALSHISVMDMCSLMGNILDNAIESTRKAPEDERLIRLTIAKKQKFAVIRCENYCEKVPVIKDNQLKTTKQDKENHGYGTKSLVYVAEKNGGSASFNAQDHWFTVSIFLPLPSE